MFNYKKLYIGGKLVDANNGRRREVFCPATDEVVGEVAWADSTDTEKALRAAQDAFPYWSNLPVGERVRYMFRLRELVIKNEVLLREAEMYEHGKTYEQAEDGYQSVINSLEYYAHEIQRTHGHLLVDTVGNFDHQIVYRSAGVVGAFVAWNFPLLNLAFKIGPAMAAGCPLILRPSGETPISAYIIGELCAEAELPAGVVNILTGPISETADLITKSSIPAVLTLIGSSETGRQIMKNGSSSIKKYSMELGGNAPAIVFQDADIDLASSIISMLKFANAGQICVTPNRIYVHESILEKFSKKVIEHAKAVVIGHGRNSGATMGPIINRKSRDRIDAWVREAIADGAKVLYGGKVPEGLSEKGSYYMPTVLGNVKDSMRISYDEIFGPVVSIHAFKSYDEVIKRANATPAGLASFVFTNDITTIQRATRDLEFGEVQVNGVKYNIDLPHIGIKQSGLGGDCSHFALDDYLVKKRITTSRQ
jgi:succinate-semialdehyde dehydrogenase/glutarate-semialdehyde dehydrogenase